MDWILEKTNLKELIESGISYEELGRTYGYSGTYIKKVAKRLGIHLEPRRKINKTETFGKGKIKVKTAICLNCGKEFPKYSSSTGKYCSNKCQQDFQHKESYKNIINGDPSIMRANYNPKPFKDDIIKEQNGVCAICGIKPE